MRWKLENKRKIFRAVIDTSLSWEEISPVLKNRFQNEGFAFRSEKKGSIKFGRGLKARGIYVPDSSSALLNFSLKENKLKAHYEFQADIPIRDNNLGYLIVTMEDLEQSLYNIEDVMVVKEGRVADNGTSLRDDKGKNLVAGVIDSKSKGDPMYGWRFLPVIVLPIISLIILIPMWIRGISWSELGISMIPMLILFIFLWLVERSLPTNIILKPDNIILRYRKKDHEITLDSIEALTGPSNTNDFILTYNYNGKKRKTVIGYEAAYRLTIAMDNRRATENLESWMLPSWRKLQDGLLAGIPNRVHSNEESKSRGFRHYMLGDPLRTLVLVKDEHDKEILLGSAKKKWNDTKYLEDLMNFALYEKYFEEVITIGKRLLQLTPENEDILKKTFSSLLHSKRLEEAEEMIQKRIEGREPSSFEELVISSIHKERGRIEEALYHIGHSVKKNPNNLDALRTWIHIVSSESGKAQALSEMDYLATQYPSAWGPPCALGEWLFIEGDLEQAESYMKSAMEREPSEEVIGFMSALYGSDGRYKELIDLVEDAKKKGEIGVAALMNLTQAYISLGSWRKAKNSLELAVKKAPLEYQPALFDIRMFLDEKGIR